MREIKFRAFHNGKMHYFDLFSNDQYRIFPDNGDDVNLDWDDANITECTGLKDADGIETYEGDIISDGHFMWQVYWCERTAAFRAKLVSHYNKVIDNNLLMVILEKRGRAKMPCEVIGNIHQNPELLEDSK